MANVSSSNSQKALVPKLRFPGFYCEWKKTILDELVDVIGGGTPDTMNDKYWGGDIKWFTPTEVGHQKYISNSRRTITVLGLEESSAKTLPANSVLLSSRATVGECSINTCQCATNQGFQSLVPKTNQSSEFIYYLALNLKRYFIKHASGSTFLEISNSEVRTTPCYVPDLTEQKRISDFLSLLDLKIEKIQRLIDLLKSYKRGVLFYIFDSDMRDVDTWAECRIGECLEPRIQKQIPTDDAPLMAFTATGGVEPKGDRYDRSFLVKDENKPYKRTEYNDFIYSSNNLDVGSIGLNKYGPAVISDVYEIFRINDNAIPTFISAAIQRPRVIADILKFRQGVIYGQYRIYAEEFLNVKIKLPEKHIQEQYACLFDTIDMKIQKETRLLFTLEQLKTALLRQMFI